MKTLAIHQPNFAPWMGFWEKMRQSDEFIILEDVQFTKGSYINRVKMENGIYTIPVNYKYGMNINEVEIYNPRQTLYKLHKTIQHNYKHIAPDFEWLTDQIDNTKSCKLMALNIGIIDWINSEMNINTPMLMSSRMNIHSTGSDRILEMCIAREATTYLTGKGGLNYLDQKKFEKHGVQIKVVDTTNMTDLTILSFINDIRKKAN